MGCPVGFRCQRLRRQRRWHENGDSGRGGHGGVNGPMAEAARGERGRCEGMRGWAKSNAHAAAQGRNRSDVLRGPREGSKEWFLLHYMGAWGGRAAGNV